MLKFCSVKPGEHCARWLWLDLRAEILAVWISRASSQHNYPLFTVRHESWPRSIRLIVQSVLSHTVRAAMTGLFIFITTLTAACMKHTTKQENVRRALSYRKYRKNYHLSALAGDAVCSIVLSFFISVCISSDRHTELQPAAEWTFNETCGIWRHSTVMSVIQFESEEHAWPSDCTVSAQESEC